jgi:hypothetical protein
MKPAALDMGVKKQKMEEEYVTTKAHKGKEGRKKGKLLFPLIRLRGSFLKFFVHPQFYCCLLFAVIILFSGCELYGTVGGDDANIEGALPYLLQGEWAYIPQTSGAPADGYIITGTTVEYVYDKGSSPTNYKGTIEFVSNYNSDSGLIIIKYTVRPTYTAYNNKDYFAIYYRNLRSDSVQLANTTTLPDYTCADTATLEEAKAKFTRMTMGNYVSWSIVQSQTRIR